MVGSSLSLLGSLLATATVGVHAERVRGLDELQVAEVFASIRARLEATGHRVVIDVGPPALVTAVEVEALAARLGAEQFLVVSLFAGPTTMRITGERFGANALSLGRAERDGPIRDFQNTVAGVLAELFPVAAGGSPTALAEPGPSSTSVTPWLLVGAGAVASAVGFGFAISSASTRSDIGAEQDYSQAGADRLDRAFVQGTVGGGLLIGGLLLVGAGLVSAVTGE